MVHPVCVIIIALHGTYVALLLDVHHTVSSCHLFAFDAFIFPTCRSLFHLWQFLAILHFRSCNRASRLIIHHMEAIGLSVLIRLYHAQRRDNQFIHRLMAKALCLIDIASSGQGHFRHRMTFHRQSLRFSRRIDRIDGKHHIPLIHNSSRQQQVSRATFSHLPPYILADGECGTFAVPEVQTHGVGTIGHQIIDG